jgi:hypothetical protein
MLDGETGASQHRFGLREIAQGYAMEDDRPLCRWRHAGLERARTLRLQRHQTVDLADGSLGLLPAGQHDEEGLHWAQDAPDQHHSGNQRSRSHCARQNRQDAHDHGCQPG